MIPVFKRIQATVSYNCFVARIDNCFFCSQRILRTFGSDFACHWNALGQVIFFFFYDKWQYSNELKTKTATAKLVFWSWETSNLEREMFIDVHQKKPFHSDAGHMDLDNHVLKYVTCVSLDSNTVTASLSLFVPNWKKKTTIIWCIHFVYHISG